MSKLTITLKVLLTPIIFVLYLFGVKKYVGEDSFVDYWRGFSDDHE